MSVRLSISIPGELKDKVDEYNTKNPYNKIVVSHVAQAAIYDKLKEVKAV